MKALKKLLIVLIIGALIAGAFMPMGSVAQLSTAPSIQVEMVWMDGPTNVTGEYANETHYVLVKVTNNGNEYLSDIDVTCEIYSDAAASFLVTDLGLNETASLNIGESMVFEFWDWTPNVADPMVDNNFWINASATGMGFMDVSASDNVLQPVIIRNVTNVDWAHQMMFDTMGTIMTPYPYVEEMTPGEESYNYSNAAHTIYYNLVNLGNVDATVTIDVAGYDIATSWVADHTDQAAGVVISAGMASGWTAFTGGTWDVTGFTDGQLNLSVSGADFGPMNTTHYFMVNDYTDVKPMMLTTDLVMMYDTTIFNTTATHNFGVAVVNSGNQDISSDFYTTLTSASWDMTGYGATSAVGTKQLIPAGTVTLIAGDAVPALWMGVTPPGVDFYQFNATAPVDPSLGEFNTTNNVTSLLLQFEDTEGIVLSLDMPMEGKYPVMSIDINATVTNDGTLNFADYGVCNVSLMVYDNNMTTDTADDVMVWNPTDTQIMGLDMTMSEWVEWTWTGAEGGKEYLIVVNATVGTNFMEQSATIKFPHPNGTLLGIVAPNQADIKVTAWDGTTEILSVMTDASGYYEMSLEAIAGMYNVTVEAPYGYKDAYNSSVMIHDDGRTTIANFDLIMEPYGNVSGTISLMEEGMPDDLLTYDDIMVEVAGTPLYVNADDVGNYTITGIMAGMVNITASKTGFTSAWNDSVEVVVDETTMYVNLTLYEDWNVMVDPAHEEMNVSIDTKVTVTFEEDINMTTINLTNTFDVMDSADASVAGSIMWIDNMSFEFMPDENLTYSEMYTVWIDTAVMSAMDMAVLHREWMSEFTVMDEPKVYGKIAGYVTDALTGDAIEDAKISVGGMSVMTDAMGMYEIDAEVGTDIDVMATKYKYDDATITVAEVMEAMTTDDQNITLKPIIDISVWVMVDGTKTEVEADGAVLEDVDVDTIVKMVFSEALNETTLAFTLDSVTGTTDWNASDMSATFTPDANLTEGTEYTLTITTDVTNATDAAILPRDTEWKFKTFKEEERVTPTITPADGAVDQAVDVEVSISFDYEMNTTATEAAITAAFGTGFTWAADNKSVVIEHADFTEGSTPTVSISDAGLSVEGYETIATTSTFTIVSAPTYDYDLGTVKDEDGNAVANANVVIKDSSGNTVWSGTTDADGNIAFSLTSPLAEGTYSGTISKTDYDDVDFTFSVDASGTATSPTIPAMKESGDVTDGKEDEFDWLPIILIIVVIIIIVVLLALAMRPKKAAEEELEEEEMEEEGMGEEEFECPECGAAVTSGEAVCPECGAEFEEEEFECPECGARIEAGAGVCPECGAEFETEEEEMEEGEEGEEDEELEDYEIEEEEEFEEEELEDEELEEEELEDEEEEEELPEDEEELSDEEEAEEEEEELD